MECGLWPDLPFPLNRPRGLWTVAYYFFTVINEFFNMAYNSTTATVTATVAAVAVAKPEINDLDRLIFERWSGDAWCGSNLVSHSISCLCVQLDNKSPSHPHSVVGIAILIVQRQSESTNDGKKRERMPFVFVLGVQAISRQLNSSLGAILSKTLFRLNLRSGCEIVSS